MSSRRIAVAVTAAAAIGAAAAVGAGNPLGAHQWPQSVEFCAAATPDEVAVANPAPVAPEPTVATLRAASTSFQRTANEAAGGGRWGDAVRARLRVAGIYNFLGLPDSALVAVETALAELDRAGEPELDPLVRAVYGETLQYGGRHLEALTEYAAGLRSLGSIGVATLGALRGRLCSNVGVAYLELGQLDSAEHYLGRALRLRAGLGDREGEAVTLGNMGRLLQSIGRPDSSLMVFDSVLALRQRRPNAVGEALALNNKGYAYDLMGMPDSALAAYDRAASLIRGRHPSHEGLTLLNRGRAYLALGRIQEARGDIEASRALERRVGDSAGENWALHDLGRVALAERRWDEAIAALDSARMFMRQQGDQIREASALYYLGIVHHTRGGTGDLQRAAAYYEAAAVARAAVARTAPRDEDRIVFAEQDVRLVRNWVRVWLGLVQEVGNRASSYSSLAAAERGRARALLDLMRASSSEIQEGANLAEEGQRLASAVGRSGGSAALSYLVFPDTLLIWFIDSAGNAEVARLPVTEEELASWTRELQAGLGAEERCDAASPPRHKVSAVLDTLSALLLPPAVRFKLPSSGEILILPHGVLNLVPFAALPIPGSDEPLGLHYPLRYAPSLAALEEAEARPGLGIGRALEQAQLNALIVGNPSMPAISMCGVEDFAPAPLAWADSSSRRVARLLGVDRLVGPSATEFEVRNRIADADIVYLATHGYAYSSEAEVRSTFVALAPNPAAPGTAADGLLTVAEILDELPVLSADLVVLGACQTGLGDLNQAEGTVGLQRALLARKARSVLVTLWNVDDRASAVLVDSFFRHWLGSAGVSKAEALRLAQREVYDAGWIDPKYWAPFQLAGAR